MKRITYSLLVMLGLLAGFTLPLLATGAHAGAVDIFARCAEADIKDSTACKDAATQKTCDEAKAAIAAAKAAGSSIPKLPDACSASNPIVGIIKGAINIVSLVVGMAAIIGIIVSGIRMATANGDSGAIAAARTGLAYSFIGAAVAVLAQTIVIFVLDKVK